MTHRSTLRAVGIAALLAAFGAASASAADIRVSCEKRSARSKVSVDGNNLAPGASYRATVTSGSSQATSPFQAAVGDEAEFDFDSNPNDIAQGATAIAPAFIVDGRVQASLLDAAGRVVAAGSAICRVRR